MKKKLFGVFIIVTLFLLAGCGGSDKFELSDGTAQKENFGEEKEDSSGIFDFDSSTADTEDPETARFALVNIDYDVYGKRGSYAADILVDQKTRVQYIYYRNGLTVLLDKDGNPLLYEGEVFYYEE